MGKTLRIGAGVAALVLLASCGEESGPSPLAAATSSDTAENKSPQHTLPTDNPRGLEVLRRWLPYGAEPGFSYVPIAIQSANESFYLNPEIINYDDPRIRHLGGRHSQPSTWPRYLMWWP